ncbi:MAG TPA: hypothetical protein VFF06_19145 [Polyangia bacterium]|nr:hypothetical protein [Polyangia bacterium]
MKVRAFIDGIESGVARLLFDNQVVKWPARRLPAGAAEGTWVEIAIEPCAAPPGESDDVEARRKKLAASDDGGDIEL